MSRTEAQKRADRIRAFREELADLRRDGVAPLTPEQEAALAAHHDEVLRRLVAQFDIDRTEHSGQLTKGMVLAALFGAATLILAINSLVERAWWRMDLPAQTTLLTMFPLAALAGVEIAARRERTRYFAAIFALVACATTWLALIMTARLLDLPFSVLLLWPGILAGLAIALSYGFWLVFGVSLVAAIVAMAGAFFASAGVPWPQASARLEPLMITAFIVAAAATRFEPAGEGFGTTARVVGLSMGLGSMFLMSVQGSLSLAPLTAQVAEGLYQAVMPILSVACLWMGLRRRQRETVMISAILLALYLLTRYVDWFWDVVPAWAFFLVLAVLAFSALALLKRLRARAEAA
jgi:hypothetical protein